MISSLIWPAIWLAGPPPEAKEVALRAIIELWDGEMPEHDAVVLLAVVSLLDEEFGCPTQPSDPFRHLKDLRDLVHSGVTHAQFQAWFEAWYQ